MEPMTPKISVLIACYNAQDYVASAIQSVIQQSFQDFEIVVVDDGSTDASRLAIAQNSDPRLRLITQENKGASAARNVAFAASRGDFVIYFDADDLMHPHHLEGLAKRADGERGYITFSPWVRFKANHLPTKFEVRPSQRDLTGPDWLATEWLDARQMMQSAMFLLPRTFIEQFGGWDERLTLNDDFEFFSRILSKARKMIYAPDAGLFYRAAVSNSLSANRSPMAIRSAYESAIDGTSHLLAQLDTAQTRLACANCLQDFIYMVYPNHVQYRRAAAVRIAELGGSALPPDGPPGFHKLRSLVGWRAARLIQRTAEKMKLNRAGRSIKKIKDVN
jgi:glycosyltransferase involved in cell wall biosynthesis